MQSCFQMLRVGILWLVCKVLRIPVDPSQAPRTSGGVKYILWLEDSVSKDKFPTAGLRALLFLFPFSFFLFISFFFLNLFVYLFIYLSIRF